MEPSMKKNYTSDQLMKKFGSQFELVNYAIKLAANMIKSGRGPRVKLDSENPALQVIAEIACNKDQLDVIDEIPVEKASFLIAPEFITPIKEQTKPAMDKTRKKQKVPLIG